MYGVPGIKTSYGNNGPPLVDHPRYKKKLDPLESALSGSQEVRSK